MNVIYGVDTTKGVTPEQVRDAIVECFFEAHCLDSGIADDKETSRDYCQAIIKKGFADTGGDFDKPSKESLIQVINGLAEFSKNFRDPTLIEKHYGEIQKLIDKIE